MEISQIIKELRIEKGMTQKELANKIEVGVSSVSYWESNTYEPKASYIKRLALFFNVSADYLLGIEDESGRKSKNID